MTSQDLVLVLGAYSALVLGAFTVLTKFVLDTRKQTTETNAAVNNRPKDHPSLRDLVERIDIDLDIQRRENTSRHDANSRRIDRLYNAVESQTRKSDRIMDALSGVNRRLDNLEERNQGDGK